MRLFVTNISNSLICYTIAIDINLTQHSSMRLLYVVFLFFLLFSTSCSERAIEEKQDFSDEDILAFPQAEGAGKYTTGGRGGLVYHVTSLRDDANDTGSLRHILSLPGAKIVVFDVSGVIFLQRELRIEEGALTIAGQTAPGDGICIAGYPVIIETSNVIIRFMRFRMGDENKVEGDALTCINRKNIIIDHCSMSWGTDECASCYGNENFTMQYCLISESLRNSVHNKGSHGYGGIWGGQTVSYHHNLLAHHDSRTPRFCGSRYTNAPELEKVDFRNNVIYNWAGLGGYAGEGGSYNMINNYYKPGPATKARNNEVCYRIFAPNADDGSNEQPKGVWGMFYVSGNIMEGYDNVTADNWNGGIQPDTRNAVSPFSMEQIKSSEVFDIASYAVTETAAEAYETVLAYAGASLVRDETDKRIVNEVRNCTYTYTGSNGSTNGIIDSQADVGGWDEYVTAELPKDSDLDGIPDDWEDAFGLDKFSYSDAKARTLQPPYSNLEVYLNSLVEHLY